ncbi:WDR19 [Lepeophtheirus salmonis]|uniref:WDR19 n=1 Tax=Lepeophtheirus salmonis TaxID=72036 RepID=A0A7R8CTW3_LEPSM|nr:WDR19 [Lepeophtheirus salmonis]CAF2930032.1 WDR19 [Lepeophtheirus salmonis]
MHKFLIIEIGKESRTSGGLLATTGYNQSVNIYNRQAELVSEIHLKGICCCFGWDKDGDLLAVINDKSSDILLWDANTRKSTYIDSGIRDPLNILIWAKKGPTMAIGSYPITCGAWSDGSGLLALGSEDRTLSISNSEGDTVRVATLRAEPSEVRFSEMKQDERSANGENTVSLIVGGYGPIVSYNWFGDGYILIGFSAGYFVLSYQTHMKEIGQELFQIKNHKESLSGIAISSPIGKAASCGDNTVKIHELHDLKDTANVLRLDDERALESIDWSEDGQLLAVTSSKGNLHVYLSKLPLLGSSHQSKVAYLTSLSEVTVVNILEDGDDEDSVRESSFTTEVEPAFLALGPFHACVGMNNRVWFYSINSENMNIEFIKDREYLGSIQEICLNADYCAVRFDGGRIQLHVLEGANAGDEEEDPLANSSNSRESRESKLFPETGKNQVISCHFLTTDFLIFGTDMGEICYFVLEDWVSFNDFKHNTGIKSMYPEPNNGTKIIFIDSKSQGFIYDPCSKNSAVLIKGFPEGIVKRILWDHNNASSMGEREGGETCVPQGQYPILLFDGEVSLQTQSGKLVKLTLSSHEMGSNVHDYSNEELEKLVDKNMALGRLKNAWAICQVLEIKDAWMKLGKEALKKLEIEFATRIFRHIGETSLVWALDEFRSIEDKMLLSGHVAMILGDYDLAQSLYLRSGTPSESLVMRRDLLQWDQALRLADKLAPDEIPFISKEYAQQLEFTGDYGGALAHYEKGLMSGDNHEEHNLICRTGISRTAIRCGDRMWRDIGGDQTIYLEAARIYESGNYYDKAAYLYIKLKNWTKIGELLPNISSPKIQLQYAKAKEADKKYRDAATAYEAGRDYDNAIRIHLDHLDDPESAVKLVKKSNSTEGAKSVSRFFLKLNDYDSAIRFLIISGCIDEAFQMAQRRGKMELFADIVGDSASHEDYSSIALYFESERNYLKAGKFFHKAGQHSKALRHLLKVSGSSTSEAEALDLAVEVVASAKKSDHHLFRQLVDFLLGETDGVPKDAKYLFRLYMARGLYKEAGKTAVIIAREEQTRGSYRNAHDVLYNMYTELEARNIPIPSEMRQNLTILHSYLVARKQIKLGDHLSAARKSFPVIECSRSGLKKSAFSHATTLMRPEYRSEIDSKYVKKIESVVRKRGDNEEPSAPFTSCPYCSNNSVPEDELYCQRCKRVLPYCILSGFHLTKDKSVLTCPGCKFPAFETEFVALVSEDGGGKCLMCSTVIQKLQECNPYNYQDNLQEEEEEGNYSEWTQFIIKCRKFSTRLNLLQF